VDGYSQTTQQSGGLVNQKQAPRTGPVRAAAYIASRPF